ncbi:MAG: HPF/RaiA family ribosome-associated protein [Rhodospirillaceae bacterium]|nr:HPF/RaiA family ribosome-associated protein [Rhodospirillaceae bacterium]
MQIPIQITFHGIDKSDAVEGKIKERVDKLGKYSNRIIGCRVVVESHHKSHSNLNTNAAPFHVTIHLSVPGEDLVVRRDPKEMRAHEDMQIALRDSFEAMERRLKDYTQKIKRVDRRQGHEVPAGEV